MARGGKAELERIARRAERSRLERSQTTDRDPLIVERAGLRAVSKRAVHSDQIRTRQRIAIKGDRKLVEIACAGSTGMGGVDRAPVNLNARPGGAEDNLF